LLARQRSLLRRVLTITESICGRPLTRHLIGAALSREGERAKELYLTFLAVSPVLAALARLGKQKPDRGRRGEAEAG
jgi:hypothetical protein